MNKLKSAISFLCLTTIKPILIFYFIESISLALIFTIISICTGRNDVLGSNGLEIISAVFLGVLGAQRFQADFKVLLQNGFTRRYIYLSTFCSFILISGAMALADTLIGNALHHFLDYSSFGELLYGHIHLFANWLLLTVFYVACCSIFYSVALVIYKAGKTISLLIGVGFAGLILLIAALFRFVFSPELTSRIGRFMSNAFGFMDDGTIHLAFPIFTIFLIGLIFGLGSYALLRRTELK